MKKTLLSIAVIAAITTTSYAQSGMTPATSLTTTLRQQSAASAGKPAPRQQVVKTAAVGATATTNDGANARQTPATNKSTVRQAPASNTNAAPQQVQSRNTNEQPRSQPVSNTAVPKR